MSDPKPSWNLYDADGFSHIGRFPTRAAVNEWRKANPGVYSLEGPKGGRLEIVASRGALPRKPPKKKPAAPVTTAIADVVTLPLKIVAAPIVAVLNVIDPPKPTSRKAATAMSYARASAQEGPRLPDDSFYSGSARANWKSARKPRKARAGRSRARASAQEGPRLPDNSFYSPAARASWKSPRKARKARKARKGRKSGSGSSRRGYARASSQVGPRLPDKGFYSPKARASWKSGGRKKASRKGRRGGRQSYASAARSQKKAWSRQGYASANSRTKGEPIQVIGRGGKPGRVINFPTGAAAMAWARSKGVSDRIVFVRDT